MNGSTGLHVTYRIGLRYRAGLLVSGGMCGGIGAMALIAKATHRIAIAQVVPSSVPIPGVAALGFLLCGIALLAMALWFPVIAPVLSMVVLSIVVLVGAEQITGSGPRIETIVATNIGFGSGRFERVAPNTLFVLLLAAAAVILRHARGGLVWRFPAIAMIGSVILAIGAVSSVGYMTSVPTFAWDARAPMSFLSALASSVLGFGLVVSAWRYSQLDECGVPHWFEAALLTGAVTIESALIAAFLLGDPRAWTRPALMPILPLVLFSAVVGAMAVAMARSHGKMRPVRHNSYSVPALSKRF